MLASDDARNHESAEAMKLAQQDRQDCAARVQQRFGDCE